MSFVKRLVCSTLQCCAHELFASNYRTYFQVWEFALPANPPLSLEMRKISNSKLST